MIGSWAVIGSKRLNPYRRKQGRVLNSGKGIIMRRRGHGFTSGWVLLLRHLNDSICGSGEQPPFAEREAACTRSGRRCNSGMCRHLFLSNGRPLSSILRQTQTESWEGPITETQIGDNCELKNKGWTFSKLFLCRSFEIIPISLEIYHMKIPILKGCFHIHLMLL